LSTRRRSYSSRTSLSKSDLSLFLLWELSKVVETLYLYEHC
jgi:hypothetical protein